MDSYADDDGGLQREQSSHNQHHDQQQLDVPMEILGPSAGDAAAATAGVEGLLVEQEQEIASEQSAHRSTNLVQHERARIARGGGILEERR